MEDARIPVGDAVWDSLVECPMKHLFDVVGVLISLDDMLVMKSIRGITTSCVVDSRSL